MIASRPFGTAFQVTGSAAIQNRRTFACAGAAATARRAVAASTATARSLTASANLELALHPAVDAAHEVERRALLGADVHLLARLRAEHVGVARLVDSRGPDVDHRLGGVALLVRLVPGEDLVADRARRAAVQDLVGALRQVALCDDRERVRLLLVRVL